MIIQPLARGLRVPLVHGSGAAPPPPAPSLYALALAEGADHLFNFSTLDGAEEDDKGAAPGNPFTLLFGAGYASSDVPGCLGAVQVPDGFQDRAYVDAPDGLWNFDADRTHEMVLRFTSNLATDRCLYMSGRYYNTAGMLQITGVTGNDRMAFQQSGWATLAPWNEVGKGGDGGMAVDLWLYVAMRYVHGVGLVVSSAVQGGARVDTATLSFAGAASALVRIYVGGNFDNIYPADDMECHHLAVYPAVLDDDQVDARLALLGLS